MSPLCCRTDVDAGVLRTRKKTYTPSNCREGTRHSRLQKLLSEGKAWGHRRPTEMALYSSASQTRTWPCGCSYPTCASRNGLTRSTTPTSAGECTLQLSGCVLTLRSQCRCLRCEELSSTTSAPSTPATGWRKWTPTDERLRIRFSCICISYVNDRG